MKCAAVFVMGNSSFVRFFILDALSTFWYSSVYSLGLVGELVVARKDDS